MAKEPTTVAGRVPFGKTSNPSNLVFPVDATGFTTMLRKEGARAAGRMGGDPARLDVFITTLKVLAEHAKTKLEAQAAARAEDLKATADRAVEAVERAAADEAREVVRLESILAATQAALDAKRPA